MANDPCKSGELWPEEARPLAEQIGFELSQILHEQNGVTAVAAMALAVTAAMAANCPDRKSFAASMQYFSMVMDQIRPQAAAEIEK